jgi:hypothetical protein
MGVKRTGCLIAAALAVAIAVGLAVLAAIVVGIGVLGSTGANEGRPVERSRPAATRPAPPPEPAAPRAVVARDEYARVQDGMAYSDVRSIIGADGEELSRVTLAGTTTIVYTWKNRDGSNMVATFQDDRLVTKAQFGLQ